MDRIFLDANVLFSAAYREGAGLLALWELPGTVVLTSGYALAEACRNLRPGEQQDRLQSLLVSATVIETAQEDSAGFDDHSLPEKDRPILRAAVLIAVAGLPAQMRLQHLEQLRKVGGECVPDAVEVDVEVRVHQSVSHGDDGRPRNRWDFVPPEGAHLHGCLTDDLNTTDDGSRSHRVRLEIASRAALCIGQSFFRRLGHVPQAYRVIPAHTRHERPPEPRHGSRG